MNVGASTGVSAWTVVGGALLGLGAWVNNACVFGTVARLGSGEWAYAATPAGFYVGCLSVMPLFARPVADKLTEDSPLFQVSTVFAALFVIFVLWRLRPGLLALRGPDRAAAGPAADRPATRSGRRSRIQGGGV